MHIPIHRATDRKNKSIWGGLVLGVLILVFAKGNLLYSEETGYKYFKNYSYTEYDHQPQNWGFAQDKNGIIYVANHGGVLEYDGVSWRLIGLPQYDTIRSLATDNESGIVYAGGVGEIGYLAPDQKGFLKYISLVGYLDDAQKKFTDVWRTYATEEGIYFNSSKFLFRWNPGRKEMKVWEPTEPGQQFIYSFQIKGKIVIQQKKSGIMHLVDEKLKLLVEGEVFSDEKEIIYMIVPYDPRDPGNINPETPTLLIGTRLTGFHLYDGKSVMPFATGVDGYLSENIFSHGTRVSTGDFALATRRGGIVIMDPLGHLKYIFDKPNGLQDNNVRNIFEDFQGNLWLALDRGISKVEYSSIFFFYDDRSGLPGSVYSVIRHRGDLYSGTAQGLYVFPAGQNKFQPMAGIFSNCWNLLSVDDSLLAATSEGVFQVDTKTGSKRSIIRDLTYVLLRSEHNPGRVWCGTVTGLVAIFKKNGQWIEECRVKDINREIRSLAEDKNGDLWLGTTESVVLRVKVPVDLNFPPTRQYKVPGDLPLEGVYVAWASGHVILATAKGIYRLDGKSEKMIPDPVLGDKFAGGSEDAKSVFRLVEAKDHQIWFLSESRIYQAIPGSGGDYTIDSKPFRRLSTSQVNAIYPDPDGKIIWFGNFDGLIRYDTTIKKNYDIEFPAIIREVSINRTNLIFGGHGIDDGRGLKPVLPYDERDLLFKCAAPFFEDESATQYRYFLEGYDEKWSDWTAESQKEYTNLSSGNYKFRVLAENVFGTSSHEAFFPFKVLPPWYKTWWAFLLYVLMAFSTVFYIVKWRSAKLEHDKQRLEQTVRERTSEINEKNQQLEKQTLQLQDQAEKLKEMDQVKSRFFANISHEFRTPLTLIMGPLEEMESESREKEQKERINLMLRNSRQLLTLINQLLDLSRIDSGKVKLLASPQDIVPFLKGILSSFQILAQHNQLGLEFQSEEDKVSLYFDYQKMEEVITNLLINAVKFTPTGGKITVSVKVGREQTGTAALGSEFVEISVQDTGMGIPIEQLPHIFDRFYQVQGPYPRDHAHKGTGIGLALVKELINLHHGNIDVSSIEDKGTTFTIRLPMGTAHLRPEEMTAHSTICVDDSLRKKIIDISTDLPREEEKVETDVEPRESEKPGGAVKEPEPGNGQEEKNVILLVEDHEAVRQYIKRSLEPTYTVVEAKDGIEGIEKAKEIIPDIIVSDIMMPQKDGYELCRELKNDIKTSHIPIILLTAKASEESVIQGLETGADDYITKPFNTKMLLSRIKNLIDLRRQLQLKIQREKMLLPAEIPVSSLDDQFLKKFQDIIGENLDNHEFTIDELCERLEMGRSTLFPKIKALTGLTPNQFIQSYRLERAAQILRKDKSRSITEISADVGFDSPAYFTKCFKDKFHQSPSTYQASESHAAGV